MLSCRSQDIGLRVLQATPGRGDKAHLFLGAGGSILAMLQVKLCCTGLTLTTKVIRCTPVAAGTTSAPLIRQASASGIQANSKCLAAVIICSGACGLLPKKAQSWAHFALHNPVLGVRIRKLCNVRVAQWLVPGSLKGFHEFLRCRR